MRRSRLLLAVSLAALVGGTMGSGCRRPVPVAAGDPLALPRAYRVQADGELGISGLRLPGRLRMDYLVAPDGTVGVTDLTAWIRDVDIVTSFLFWETGRERLRCTKLSQTGTIFGRLEAGGRLLFPAGAAELTGVSFDRRAEDRTCPGLARQVTARNNAALTATHDPAGDHFAMSGSFRGRFRDEDVAIEIAMAGSFLNRPPAAQIGVFEPPRPKGISAAELPGDFDLPQGGCPPLRGTNPPGAVANSSEGLRLQLISLSSDPDGRGRGGRGDVARDVWSHSVDGGPFRSLGRTQIVPPVLFELHRDHVLVLTTSDHAGAAAREVCRFRVITAAEAGA